MPTSKQCHKCSKWFAVKEGEGHGLCRKCNNERLHPPPPPVNDCPSRPSTPPNLFGRIRTPLSPPSERSRFALVTMYKMGEERTEIAKDNNCSLNTVTY